MKQCVKNLVFMTMVTAGMWMTAAPSSAHHLWVQKMNDSFAVCRGNIGRRLDSYNPSCVTQISAKSRDGKGLSITRTNEQERVLFTTKENPAIVAVTSDWGDRVNTTRGKKLMNRQAAEAEGLTVVSAFTSTQFSKTILSPSDINTLVLGLRFELVPLADPVTLAPGTPAAFKLLFDGRPLAGASVMTNSGKEFKTDKNGVVQMTIDGACLMYATHKIPAEKGSGLDFLKFMTFLTFGADQ